MPDFRRSRCMVERGGCGRHRSEVGLISWGGLCPDCAKARFNANLDQLKAHEGEFFQHHRRQCVLAFGGILIDDVLDEQ